MNYYQRRLVLSILSFVLSFFFLFSSHPFALEREILRIWAGLDLFPSMLAADSEITNKKGDDGKLLLILMCKNRSEHVEDMANYLRKLSNIRKIPIRVEVATHDTFFKTYESNTLAGIFLLQPVSKNELHSLISYGKKNHIIVFSPFEGDVERGAHGGIVISDRILPYINLKTIRLSKIKIKDFFSKVAEKYE